MDTWSPPSVVAPGDVVPFTAIVTPVRPGHMVTIEYRVDRGPIRQLHAVPDAALPDLGGRVFRAMLPSHDLGVVEFIPVLRFAGQAMSPRLDEGGDAVRYTVAPSSRAMTAASAALPAAPHPRWAWEARYLGALTVTLRKEVVGPTPDGLRIDWHVTDGTFVGPGLEARVLPGGADWMRIREDGIGIVDVTACLETSRGARIFANYGGVLDFGPDGYARALRDDFDALPPLVVTPSYSTADESLAWINRVQCVGVGHVDMRALRVMFDAYVISVGAALGDANHQDRRLFR